MSQSPVVRLFSAAAIIAAANAILLAMVGSYDVWLGPIHLVAHGLFKPLLYVSGAVLAAMLVRSSADEPTRFWAPPLTLIALAVVLVYLPSAVINPTTYIDWTHRSSTAGIHTLGDALGLFVTRQPDGFYRPITFISLWADRVIFGDRTWGYHLQNIALHAANAVLVARLGIAYGLHVVPSRWAGLIFGLAAVNYEPVLWPGARFDVMAGLFTLGALIVVLRYLDQPSNALLAGALALFALGVFAKESAYCFPPLFFLFCLNRSSVRKNLGALAATAAVTLTLLGIRFAILGGLGGYPDERGLSPHYELGLRTFTSFFTRALPAPLLLLNTDADLTWYARLAVILFAVWAAAQVLSSAGAWRENLTLLGAALIAALPAANLVDWIGPIAHNVRYVYLTSVWIFLFTAAVTRMRRLLAILAIANALGVVYNLRSYEWIDPEQRPEAKVTAPGMARATPLSLR